MKWVFKSKEEPEGLIHLKSINTVNGYMQVPVFDYIESFSPLATDTSTGIMIGLTLYQKEEVWVAELFDVEAVFVKPDMAVKVFIKLSEGIVDLGIITREFLEEYFIILGKNICMGMWK